MFAGGYNDSTITGKTLMWCNAGYTKTVEGKPYDQTQDTTGCPSKVKTELEENYRRLVTTQEVDEFEEDVAIWSGNPQVDALIYGPDKATQIAIFAEYIAGTRKILVPGGNTPGTPEELPAFGENSYLDYSASKIIAKRWQADASALSGGYEAGVLDDTTSGYARPGYRIGGMFQSRAYLFDPKLPTIMYGGQFEMPKIWESKAGAVAMGLRFMVGRLTRLEGHLTEDYSDDKSDWIVKAGLAGELTLYTTDNARISLSAALAATKVGKIVSVSDLGGGGQLGIRADTRWGIGLGLDGAAEFMQGEMIPSGIGTLYFNF